MAESQKTFVPSAANNIPTVETVLTVLTGSTDQDTSLASLPSAPIAGCRAVRIRASLMITSAPGGALTVRIRAGNGTGGALIPAGVSLLTAAAPAAGTPIQFETWDTAPVAPLVYSVTVQTATSAGACFAICEIEEVN